MHHNNKNNQQQQNNQQLQNEKNPRVMMGIEVRKI